MHTHTQMYTHRYILKLSEIAQLKHTSFEYNPLWIKPKYLLWENEMLCFQTTSYGKVMQDCCSYIDTAFQQLKGSNMFCHKDYFIEKSCYYHSQKFSCFARRHKAERNSFNMTLWNANYMGLIHVYVAYNLYNNAMVFRCGFVFIK